MLIDLPNCVAGLRIPKSRVLLPVFEALSNSLDAISDGKVRNGQVDIYLTRDTSQKPLDGEIPSTEAIIGVEIVDNGIGFTQPNYDSFCTSFSSHKKASGGKGIGRLSWLRSFDHAEIESIYRANGESRKRTFRFELTPDGIAGHDEKVVNGDSLLTRVRLVGARAAFQAECRRSTEYIAHRVIEHFLQLFAIKSIPQIFIHEADGSSVCLNQIFESEVRLEEKSQSFKIEGHSLSISHVRLGGKLAADHRLHFCARNRSVVAEDATRFVSNLQGRLIDPAGGPPFVYAAYVSGPLLSKSMIPDRNSFDLPNEGTVFAQDADLTWEQVVRAAAKQATRFLAKYTAPTRKANLARIKAYVEKHPKYRPLVKHREHWLDRISLNVRDDELDMHLYRLSQEYDADLRKQGIKVDAMVVNSSKLEVHRAKVERFLEEWNEQGHAKLCDYVVHRRSVLSFLEDCLKRASDGDFKLEDIVHDTIFPMRQTSDDVAADATNLWVIDERLCYHYYLASDKQFRSIEPVQVPTDAALKRPDLLAFQRFDNPTAIVDSGPPYDAVTIVEFKRPGRDDYTDADNPINQVERYVQDIKKGKVERPDGQRLTPKTGTPFYAYIICTITPSLETIAERQSFMKMPDEQGYFKMHPTLGVYEEIISYEKLLADAKKRNNRFFEKMNMPIN